MTDPSRPSLDRVETLGDDTPGLVERLGTAARNHPRGATALLGVGALLVLTVVGIVVWRWLNAPAEVPPGPLDSAALAVSSTGQGGVVIDRRFPPSGGSVDQATVRLEMKVTLTTPPGAVGMVLGMVGPGIGTSDAAGIPPISSGNSVVGLVTATVNCATAPGSVESDQLATREEIKAVLAEIAGRSVVQQQELFA